MESNTIMPSGTFVSIKKRLYGRLVTINNKLSGNGAFIEPQSFLRGNLLSFFAIIFTSLILLFSFFRLYFGVDFTDEAFYVTMPYRFAIGARPFVDEVSLVQTSSLIILPIIKLYYWLVGSADGIMLFTRRVYFVYALLIGGLSFTYFKSFMKWQVALLISLTFTVFIPFNIPSLSYNTLGYGLFTIGCIIGIWIIINEKREYYFTISGLFHGLAIFAYPTILIPVLFFIGSMIFFFNRKLRVFVYYVLGAILAIAPFLPLLFNAGLDNLISLYTYAHSIGAQGGGLNKLVRNMLIFWNIYPLKSLVILVLIIIYVSVKKNLVSTSYLLLLLPLFPLLPLLKNNEVSSSMLYVSYYSFLAPYLLLFIQGTKNVKEIFWGLWAPSFIAGLTFAWSSSNGYINAGLGFYQGSLVTAYFTYELLLKIQSSKDAFFSFLNKVKLILGPVLVVSILVFFQYASVYRDNSIFELKTKVESGPYTGMFTTPEKNEYLTSLSKDLRQVSVPGSNVLFYDRFPAGYLLTSMTPATNTCWLFQLKDYPTLNRQATIDYYEKNNIQPDIIIKMKKILVTKQSEDKLLYLPNDSLNNMVESKKYSKILSSNNYIIYQKN